MTAVLSGGLGARNDYRHRIFNEVRADIAGTGDSQEELPVAGIDRDDGFEIERYPRKHSGYEPDHQAQNKTGEAELRLLGRGRRVERTGVLQPDDGADALSENPEKAAKQQCEEDGPYGRNGPLARHISASHPTSFSLAPEH
jgi:hypothetical protein